MGSGVEALSGGHDFLNGGGEMGALMRAHDWASTELGSPKDWPQALKLAVRLILNTGHPMYIWWGPDLFCFYNDAYSRTLGPERHPGSLGQPGRGVWAEIWHLIGHQVDFVMEGKGSTWDEHRCVPITRFGRLDEIYWTYSYSPIHDETAPNGIGGVLVVCTETTKTVMAERRLASETERQRRLFEQAPGFIAILSGPEHVFEFVNQSYELLFDRRGFLGKTVREAFPEVEGQGFYELLDGVYQTGERFIASAMSISLQPTPEMEPSERLLDFIYEPVRDETGTITGIFVEGYDVTDRARAEAGLREAEERYLALFNAIDQGFCTIEVKFDERDHPVDYRFLEISPSFERQTGITNGAGRWMRDIAPDQDQHWFDTYGRVARTGEAARFENYSTPLNRWWEVYAFRISGPNRIAVLFRDITEQKRAEKRLRDTSRRLNAVLDNASVSIFLMDDEHQCIYMNPAAEQLTGYKINETQGRHLHDIIHHSRPDGSPYPAEDCPIDGVTLGSERQQGEEVFVDKGGRFIPVSFAASAILDDTGAPVGTIIEAQDISERKAAEASLQELTDTLECRVRERTAELVLAQEALRQSQKLESMGQLTGGVAHDFNNLLTPIVGVLDLLHRQGLGGDREQRLVDGALQSAERAKTLVQRLLAFARRQPLQPRAVDLGALVSNMADLVDSTTGPQIKVVVDVADELPAAVADPNQVEMALLNLAVNARDAMEGGGTLRISAESETIEDGHRSGLRPGRYLCLSVADTGVGMDEATLARAVEPFFSTKGVGRGTGLGLSMVHGLAAQLGGAMTLKSSPGLGSNIEIWLPASDASADETSGSEDSLSPFVAAGTALLVDDEALVRMSTADMLTDLGYKVVQAASAEEALRLVDAGLDPSLLVTDHLMPGKSGTELARELRGRRPETRVLVMSGYAEVDDLAPDLMRLIKPFRQADLGAKLRELDEL